MDKYTDWVHDKLSRGWNPYGSCAEWTKEMNYAFPELIRVRGFYHCPIWGRRTHWWLKTQHERIVDPTARQFPSKGMGVYEEVPDDKIEEEVPTGVCMYCGVEVYKCADFCSDVCSNNMVNEINASFRNESYS